MLHTTARAKLNYYLHIIGKREDGYHLLDSLVTFLKFGDEITVEEAQDLSLTMHGEFAPHVAGGEHNLIIKAAKELQKATGTNKGAKITLEKKIPVGAGLGGGSCDASATVKLLNKLWGLNLRKENLTKIIAPLGADIPVCMYGMPAFVRGIGDIITKAQLDRKLILLVNPRRELLTKEVYSKIKIGAKKRDGYRNDLEEAAISLEPKVGEILEVLRGLKNASLVRMCGSGATCFAVFDDETSLHNARMEVEKTNPQWWVKETRTKINR